MNIEETSTEFTREFMTRLKLNLTYWSIYIIMSVHDCVCHVAHIYIRQSCLQGFWNQCCTTGKLIFHVSRWNIYWNLLLFPCRAVWDFSFCVSDGANSGAQILVSSQGKCEERQSQRREYLWLWNFIIHEVRCMLRIVPAT